jgi:alpha-tubulin suppressor-like RCC1 family protein
VLVLALSICAAAQVMWPSTAAAASHATMVSVGQTHACAIIGGKAYCWGLNTNGQLGNNSTTQSLVPVAVNTAGVLAGKTLTRVSAGTSSSYNA